MENKKMNGFTLIELLSVIVIFAITFLFVLPGLTELFTMGNKTEIELIEERVLKAAKEYVNNYDGTFYKNFYKEGDTSYVYKSDLLNAGLITDEEVSKLNTWGGVKGELLKNDRIRYTVEYINASNNEYTNEELYLMIKNLQNQSGSSNGSGNTNSEVIEELNSLKSRVDNVEEVTSNMSVLKSYPVGSIYVSVDSANPGTLFGGTWVAFGAGRTLVGVDSTQTEFASVGLTGGEKTHTLTIDEMPMHRHRFAINIQHSDGLEVPYQEALLSGLTAGGRRRYFDDTEYQGGSQAHNNLQPYITVYMWKRTA